VAHARAQIRNAAVALLTGLATTGNRVYHGRTRPLKADHAPTLLVYATDEASAAGSTGHPVLVQRILTLMIEGRVIGNFVPDDMLDAIAAEVETAIGADPSIGGLALDTQLAATRIAAQPAGERQAGEIRLEFRVTYFTRENAPATAL
jgi:hypothetical protein